MCITIAEQKRLLKKLGRLEKSDGPFEMHETLVASLDRENRLSRRVDNLLERKFGKRAAVLLQLDEQSFLAEFKTALESGTVEANLWATAVSPDLSIASRRAVFGDIHMTMHWNGEQLMQFKRKLSRQQQDMERMQQRITELSRQRREIKKEVNGYKREKNELKAALAAERREKAQLQQAATSLPCDSCGGNREQNDPAMLREMDSLRMQLDLAKRQISAFEGKNLKLSLRPKHEHKANRHVRQEARTILAEMTAMNRCDESCPAFDLCKKRILIVGGVTRMETLYRDLIESSNGVFDYHDGYVRKGAKDLESSLKRADMVLCPVNCNSHAACSIVKNLGKKHNKTVHIIANGSLSAVSQVIRGEDANVCILN
jgi:myosin heavy subunit